MFARSTLTVWDQSTAGGWSNTSGGGSNGTFPGSGDDVVFDANSGSVRTITCTSALCNSITTVGSLPLGFNGDINPYGNIDLTNMVSVSILQLQNVGAGSFTLKAQNVSIGSLITAIRAITLLSDINVTGALWVNGNFNANNFNVSCLSFLGSGGTPTVTMGSGTWTISGLTGIIWDPSSAAIIQGTSTLKFTGNSSSSKSISGSKTYNNFWNATSGGGGLILNGSNVFNNFKIGAGSIQSMLNGTNTTITSLTADGTGLPITIQSDSPGSRANLTKSGGGSVYVDYCNIKDIVASPIATFNARNSVDQGNNINWTFIPGNSKFMAFF
jgi:hypothetical protein